jgi:hypothetical protein
MTLVAPGLLHAQQAGLGRGSNGNPARPCPVRCNATADRRAAASFVLLCCNKLVYDVGSGRAAAASLAAGSTKSYSAKS